MSLKNSLTPAGIEPATFQFVAQHLNHSATAVPLIQRKYIKLKFRTLFSLMYAWLMDSILKMSVFLSYEYIV